MYALGGRDVAKAVHCRYSTAQREGGRRGGTASTAEPGETRPGIRGEGRRVFIVVPLLDCLPL
jgi:hypothetical protein